MSNKFDKQEIIDKGTELKTNLATVHVDLQGTKNSVDYILNNAEFKGEFAENTKSYYTEVHGKAIEILTTLLEAIQLAGDKLKQNADTLDSDNSAKIDTDYLTNEQKNEMQTAQEAYTTHKAVIQGQISSVGDIVSLSMPSENFGDKTEDAKRELQAITTRVDEFSSNSVVNEISSLVTNFDSLMAYMDSCQTENGNVKYAAGDLGKQPWYKSIEESIENVPTFENDGVSKKNIKDMLAQKYGFDETTAEQIYKLQKNIKDKHPDWNEQQIAYEYNRILAACCKNYRATRFEIVTGTPKSEEVLDNLLREYGLSSEEQKTLKTAIQNQHETSQNKNNNDFAHEAVQIAGFNKPTSMHTVFSNGANADLSAPENIAGGLAGGITGGFIGGGIGFVSGSIIGPFVGAGIGWKIGYEHGGVLGGVGGAGAGFVTGGIVGPFVGAMAGAMAGAAAGAGVGITITSNLGNSHFTNEEISWKGDYDSGRFDQTDIRSDMDSMNINNRIHKEKPNNLLSTQTKYFNDITKDKEVRQKEFYGNYGNGDIEKGKERVREILHKSTPASIYIGHRTSRESGKNAEEDFWRYINNA